MKTRPLALALWLGALAPAAPALAQQDGPTATYERYALSAEASAEVPNDLLVARLAARAEGEDPAALAERVNRTMTEALDALGSREGLAARTLDYRTEPVYGEPVREVVAWRAVQQLELRTADLAAGSAAIGELQATLSAESVRLEPAPATRRAAEGALVVEALEAFEARAGLVARTMGAQGHRVVRAEVQTEGGRAPVYARAAMEASSRSDARAAPALAAGTTELTVRVYGTVELER